MYAFARTLSQIKITVTLDIVMPSIYHKTPMGSFFAVMVEPESDYATSLIACFDPR